MIVVIENLQSDRERLQKELDNLISVRDGRMALAGADQKEIDRRTAVLVELDRAIAVLKRDLVRTIVPIPGVGLTVDGRGAVAK